MKRIILITLFFHLSIPSIVQSQISINVALSDSAGEIDRHIFGQFSEHLGRGIYSGIWVGKDSAIPNIEGYRTDVLSALQELKIPNMRWPGGCFADDYNWRDGIGPKEERPITLNAFWGQVPDDNSFGTHEFLRLMELIDTEPYISANVGSSTPKDMSDWIEYLTFSGDTDLTRLRKENGRDKPWKIKFWGIGNESWGCGGNMIPQYYSNEYRKFATYARNLSGNTLFKIASGKYDVEYDWTDTVVKNAAEFMDAISLHYYTIPTGDWGAKGPSIGFDEDVYIKTLQRSLRMDEFIIGHSEILDKYDPEKRIVLAVDEWGIWTDPLTGTNSGFLEQQNSLRDAFIASTTFDIFIKHNDRVKLANIAQTVNVLQAMVLTSDEDIVITPTYYAFDFYKVHHDALLLPITFQSPTYQYGETGIPAISTSISKGNEGLINITLTNVDPNNEYDLEIVFDTELEGEILNARVLSGFSFNSYNKFGEAENVTPISFENAEIDGNKLILSLPSKSLIVIQVK